MKLTDREMKALLDAMNEAGIKHDKDCPWKNSWLPINECSCNCYEFALMQGGALMMQQKSKVG